MSWTSFLRLQVWKKGITDPGVIIIYSSKTKNGIALDVVSFTIVVEGRQAEVKKVIINEAPVYLITLFGQPVRLTKARTKDQQDFWTFLPSGDKQIANRIGRIIEQYENQ